MLLRILSEEGSAGITCFFALKYNEAVKKETLQLVLVPTREDGTHIWAEDAASAKVKGKGKADDGGAVAFDGGLHCPPYC